jgi:1-acyl-sn-glycerol-3-phosphate acyltransferase
MSSVCSKAAARAITGGIQLLTGVQSRWAGSGPSKAQRIYFANHTSHFDFLLVLAALPHSLRGNTRPVAAKDYWMQCSYRRWLAGDVFEATLIERACAHHAARPLDPVLETLDQGYSLIFFPEGTRGSGEELLAFKPGIFHVAQERPNVELVPAWIDNAFRVMPKGCLLPVPLLCSVTFGSPLHLEQGETKEGFLGRLRGALSGALNNPGDTRNV